MEAFVAGAWRQIARGEIYIGGQWRRLTRAEGYIGAQWRSVATFTPTLSVSIEPNYAQGYANPLHPVGQTITTNAVAATPSGGLGPYSYAWSGGNTPSNAVNSFTRFVPADSDITDSASVTVTDALGATASATVDLYFSNQSQFG